MLENTLTPNQVVAYNLGRARRLRGWTQEQAAEQLAPALGETWSKAAFSAAERSIAGKRIRQFTADDIVAFARVFQLPTGWFFLPPPPWEHPDGRFIAVPDAPHGHALKAAELVDLVLDITGMDLRLAEFFGDADTPGGIDYDELSPRQAQLQRRDALRTRRVLLKTLGDVTGWARTLRELASSLDTARREAGKDSQDKQL